MLSDTFADAAADLETAIKAYSDDYDAETIEAAKVLHNIVDSCRELMDTGNDFDKAAFKQILETAIKGL